MFGYAKKIKDSFNEGLHGETLTEEEENTLYAEANAELNSDKRDEGIWAKSLAKGGSNPEGKYIEYRFNSLKSVLLREKNDLINIK